MYTIQTFFSFWLRESEMFIICFRVFVALAWKKQNKKPPQKASPELTGQEETEKKKKVTVWEPLLIRTQFY